MFFAIAPRALTHTKTHSRCEVGSPTTPLFQIFTRLAGTTRSDLVSSTRFMTVRLSFPSHASDRFSINLIRVLESLSVHRPCYEKKIRPMAL